MTKLLLLLLLLTAAPVCLSAELVILMSWDGFRHDLPDRGDYPALKRIEEEGIRTRLVPTVPSNTFPGHATLATGTSPDVHGILDNRMYDREKGGYAYGSDASWLNAEPVWIAVERQGSKAATYFWVGSESDWRGQSQSYRMAPFDNSRPESEKVRQMIEWIDLPAPERPSLIMAYWRGSDYTAHVKGPDHPDVDAEIADQDAQLQVLLDAIDKRGLWDSTTLIITADHGMAEVKATIPVSDPLQAEGIQARVVGGSTVKRVFLDDAARLEDALAILQGIDNISVYTGDDIPAELRFPNRTGDIVVTTGLPYALGQDTSFLAMLRRSLLPVTDWTSGGHGYDPHHTDMAAVFLAMGAGVEQGRNIDSVNQDQVAATVTDLLGLAPPLNAVGRPIVLSESGEFRKK